MPVKLKVIPTGYRQIMLPKIAFHKGEEVSYTPGIVELKKFKGEE